MRKADVVQIHSLAGYSASLLNRDDAGAAKRILFGDEVRTRVSSQCLKKHWREAPGVTAIGEMAVRSRKTYQQFVMAPLIEEHGVSPDEARAVAAALIKATLGADTKKEDPTDTGNIVVLSPREIGFLTDLAARVLAVMNDEKIDVKEALKKPEFEAKANKANLQLLPMTLDMAMFGRFVTGDLFSRVDSSVSVAHAFTTHGEASEMDYFTAVDTLNPDEETGAGLVASAELTTGLFYSYVAIDMNQLRDNLGEQGDVAETLAARLVRAMATVSPGAKRGSTAPYAYSEFIMLERDGVQPRTLANAFRRAVKAEGKDLGAVSVEALFAHKAKLDRMHGANGAPRVATIHDVPEGAAEVGTLYEVLAGTFGEG